MEKFMKCYHKPVLIDECGYEGNINCHWGHLSGFEMVNRLWHCFVMGGYGTHGETFMHPEDILWWGKGGRLYGESVARIGFLKEIINELPGALEPVPSTFVSIEKFKAMQKGLYQDEMTDFVRAIIDMPLKEAERVIDDLTRDIRIFTGHCGEAAYLAYYGRYCTAVGEMELPESNRYRIEMLDVWNMTRETIHTDVNGKVDLKLPVREGIAVLATKMRNGADVYGMEMKQEEMIMACNCIRPGQVWLDTDGKRIQAHGGSVIYVDGVYYWYGENKEFTTEQDDIWTWGVRCYASKDLYNWEDKGLIIEPVPDDPESSLCPTTEMLDRPHIIYNKETKKYVCWMKIMHKDGTQTETIMTADHILGPYEMVREGLKPLGMSAGDFDLAVAPDGKAYYYFERVHSETICADLTPDYTDVTGYYSTHFPRISPPDVREATAHFYRNGKHYLVTSGTTGYLPNPSEVAVADTWHGPYMVLGNPHTGDDTNTSFHSQISCIFKVQGKKDLYIACADRWLPELQHLEYKIYSKLFKNAFDPDIKTEDTVKEMRAYLGDDSHRHTAISDYVWLPLRFDGEMVYIDWKEEWRIEDYE